MKILGKEVQGTSKFLGTLEITDKKILVTDPCYELGVWCQKQISNAQQGTWKGFLYKKIDPFDLEMRDKWIKQYEADIALESMEKSTDDDKVEDHVKKVISQFRTREAQERIEKIKNTDYSRVSLLLVHHDSIDPFSSFENEWKHVKGTAGVDSGQMAICGLDFWKKNPLDYEGEETIDPETGRKQRGRTGDYWKVCDITLGSDGGGIYKNGAAVSRTGWGDGGYDIFKLTHNKKVVGVAVVFMPDYGEEE